MKKRFLSVALAAAVAMSATACTSNPAESKTTAAPAETKAEETTAAEASSEGEKKEAAADGDLCRKPLWRPRRPIRSARFLFPARPKGKQDGNMRHRRPPLRQPRRGCLPLRTWNIRR